MKLSDLRRHTVKKSVRIRFQLGNGMECIINEHGIAQVPQLSMPPDFNLEAELAGARDFIVEPAVVVKASRPPRPEALSRDELAAIVSGSGGEPAHDDHDE
jgi:hypothetical protein